MMNKLKILAQIVCYIFTILFLPVWMLVNLIFPIIALTYKIGWPRKKFKWHNSGTKVIINYNFKAF